MSDYQAIYDAVRSRISGGNVGEILREVIGNAFDISWMKSRLEQEATAAICEYQRPSVVYRAQVLRITDKMRMRTTWRAFHGCRVLGKAPPYAEANVLRAWDEGVWADGETPEAAMYAFDKKWREQA